MATHFIQIFWGLLLVVLDFSINQIDILPDFLGYVLVALGCRGLCDASPRFSTAANLAWVMVVLAVVILTMPEASTPAFSYLCTAVDCAMMWFMLGGVIALADFRQRPDLSLRASNRRIAYVTIVGISTLLGLMEHPRTGAEIGFMLAISVIVVMCLILHLIHRAIRELSDGPRR